MEYIEYTTKAGNSGKRRLNPETGTMFKKGDTLPDGSIFISYDSNTTTLGYFVEKWKRPSGYKKQSVHPRKEEISKPRKEYKYCYDLFTRTARNKKSECKKLNIKFDLDKKYLESIYPKEGLCPIFNIPMVEGSDGFDRPELDRVYPHKGYTKGNVKWVSGRANRLKSDGTLEEFESIIKYLKNCS